VFVTDFFAPRYSQWKIFVGVLFLLLIFHMAVSFFFGRLPTSPMLSGMAVEYAEKKKLGVLLVMHFLLLYLYTRRQHICCSHTPLPFHSSPAVFGRTETACFCQGVLRRSRAVPSGKHVKTGYASSLWCCCHRVRPAVSGAAALIVTMQKPKNKPTTLFRLSSGSARFGKLPRLWYR
jgi:hypothetical protein